jgi:hypothetical protein
MDATIDIDLCALLRVIFDLRVPAEGEAHLQIKRPETLGFSELSWLERLVDAIIGEVLLSFDLRRKSPDDDPEEIEAWKTQAVVGGWVERRKNHRLRIRTAVDDLFEQNVPLSSVPANVRAWKIQIADECADAILSRFHLRAASSGPWATYRRTMYDIEQNLQQALGCQTLFLMTGRANEVKTMESAIASAYQAAHRLVQELEEVEVGERS